MVKTHFIDKMLNVKFWDIHGFETYMVLRHIDGFENYMIFKNIFGFEKYMVWAIFCFETYIVLIDILFLRQIWFWETYGYDINMVLRHTWFWKIYVFEMNMVETHFIDKMLNVK